MPHGTAEHVALELRDHRQRPRADVEDLGEPVAHRVEAVAGVEPEDRPQDDLERQRLEAAVERGGLVQRPALHLAFGNLLHQAREPQHLLAVEGGQHQLALLEVCSLVQEDHGVRADDRLEDHGALAGVQDVGRGLEELLQLLRVGEHDEGRRPDQADRESLAVARAAALEEGVRARPPADGLDDLRRARPGRQLVSHPHSQWYPSGRGGVCELTHSSDLLADPLPVTVSSNGELPRLAHARPHLVEAAWRD